MSNSDEDSACSSAPSARGRHKAWSRAFKELFPQLMKKLSAMQNTYIYQDLAYHDDIRILKIMCGDQAAPLKCMLLPSALPAINGRSSSSTSKMHDYFALSYCRGREEPTHPITMYDEQLQKLTLSNSIFYIQENVAAALRHFRREDADVNIWIDALCINQANDDEKTAQVSRMHEIYSMADYVCVWLGAGKPETRDTFRFLNTILKLERLDRLIDNEQSLESWMLVLQLLRHPWFRRRWVIQELVLAQRAIVRWGEEWIEWSDFADAISLFVAKYEQVRKLLGSRRSFSLSLDNTFSNDRLDPRDIVVNTLVDVTSNRVFRSSDGSIIRAVNLEVLVSSLFLAFEATDPRDTIFAVLSLASDAMPSNQPIPVNAQSRKSNQLLHFLVTVCWAFLKYLLGWSLLASALLVPRPPTQSLPADAMRVDERISPNYKKSLTDVYADFMEYCIENSMSLDILCRHWAPGPTAFTPRQILELEKAGQKTEPESLPTWIPRIEGHAFWGRSGIQYGRSRRNGDSFVADLERQIRRPYNASKSLPPNIKFGRLRPPNQKTQWKRNPQKDTPEKSYLAGIVDPRSSRLGKYDGTLHVRGFKLGIIEKLSGRVLNGVIPGEALRYGGWPEEPKSGSFPTATNVPDRLWRTLVADRGPYGDNAPRWYRRACVEVLINVNSNGDLNTEVLLGLEDLPTAIREYMTRIQEVTWNRKFFLAESRTSESLYGLLRQELDMAMTFAFFRLQCSGHRPKSLVEAISICG